MRLLFSCVSLEVISGPCCRSRGRSRRRCERAGAAIVLRPDEVTPDAVRAALRRLLDETEFRAGAERVAAEIAAMPTAAEAAAAVEAFAGRR